MKELLKQLLEYYKESGIIGICTNCAHCFSDTRTFDIVLNYIKANKPSPILHKEHYEIGKDNPLSFWWSRNYIDEESRAPRIAFLEYLISITPDKL